MPHRVGRGFAGVFLALLVAHVVIVGTTRLYPFVELPNHLAAATIAREAEDPASGVAGHYVVETGLRPNIAHFSFCSWRLFASAERANRAFLLVYVLLLPASALLVVYRAGGNPWCSLLSFLALYNHSVHRGLVGFAIAIPAVLLVVALSTGQRRRIDSLWVALLLVATFFMHALAALFASFFVVVEAIWTNRRDMRRAVPDLAAVVPVAGLVSVWWIRAGDGTGAFLAQYYRGEFWRTLVQRLSVVWVDGEHLLAGPAGRLVAASFVAVVAAPLLWHAARRRGRRERESAGEETARARSTLLVFTLCALAACVLLPPRLPGQSHLWSTFAVFAVLGCAFLLSVGPWRRPRRAVAVAVTLAIAVHMVLWGSYFAEFSRENARFIPAFLPRAPSGAVLGGPVGDLDFRGRPVYVHFSSYAIVWKRGLAVTALSDYRFANVIRLEDREPVARHEAVRGLDVRAIAALTRSGPVLVRTGSDPPRVEGSRATRVASPWYLYERSEDAAERREGERPRGNGGDVDRSEHE